MKTFERYISDRWSEGPRERFCWFKDEPLN